MWEGITLAEGEINKTWLKDQREIQCDGKIFNKCKGIKM